MDFVAFVGEDKENWGQITALMSRLECEKVILVKNKNVVGFPDNEKTKSIEVDTSKSLSDVKNEILSKIKNEIGNEFDVSLSLASGSGKEHMALLAALLNVPVGVRLVIYTKSGIEFIS